MSTQEKDLAKEVVGSQGQAIVSDHVLEPEIVTKPPKAENESVVLGPERPPITEQPIERTRPIPIRPPPTFATIRNTGKGKLATQPATEAKGKTTVFIPDPTQQLQATLGIPPANEMELYQRQICAQQLGGLHPSMYNWLVFGKAPATVIPSQNPEFAVESVSDAISPNALNDVDPESTDPRHDPI